jgi:LacI family transcriptional regulator
VTDVARAAGVSAMTVSRVVNHESNVSDETREKVLKAVAELGYVPNTAARALAGGKQCKIALLHSNPSSAYLSEFLMGSLAQAAQGDLQLVVEYCGDLDPAELVARLVEHRTDAVLLPPPLCDDVPIIMAIHNAGMPIARIATGRPTQGSVAVTIDDLAAAKAMTAHLVAHGHKRIGFIEGPSNQSVSALRRQGYEAALAAAGLAFDPQLVALGDFTYRSGLDAAEALLALSNRPTAIFASNDDMAAACVATAHRHRLDVPGDLSVCGFDDTAMATTIWPELTTIRQPIAEMARVATDLLGEDVRGRPDRNRNVQLDFELITRASDGPPKTA